MDDQKAKILSVSEIEGFTRIQATTTPDLHKEMVEGGYIKLLIGVTGLNVSDKPTKRTFTLSQIQSDSFFFDMVSHETQGPASNWRREAKSGTLFHFKGPGPPSKLNKEANAFFFAGDKTAMPAIRAHLKSLDPQKEISLFLDASESENYAYFEDLAKREKAIQFDDEKTFIEKLKKKQESSFLWVAGEREMSAQFRALCSDLNLFDKYISSYWQKGLADEKHRENKVKLK